MGLSGKVSFISGAARGIGRATAERFALEGSRIALFDIDSTEGSRTLCCLRDKGADVILTVGDVSKATDVKSAISDTVATFSRLDVLINCAGILLVDKDVPVDRLAEDVWDQVIAVNLKGTYLTCKYAIPEMIKNGGGAIVNTASISAFRGWGRVGAYSASKAGVMGLTRDMAHAYAHLNIRVNAVAPGLVDTAMQAQLGSQPETIAITPLKRMGRPEEIASAIHFLASEASSFITGTVILIDGGLST